MMIRRRVRHQHGVSVSPEDLEKFKDTYYQTRIGHETDLAGKRTNIVIMFSSFLIISFTIFWSRRPDCAESSVVDLCEVNNELMVLICLFGLVVSSFMLYVMFVGVLMKMVYLYLWESPTFDGIGLRHEGWIHFVQMNCIVRACYETACCQKACCCVAKNKTCCCNYDYSDHHKHRQCGILVQSIFGEILGASIWFLCLWAIALAALFLLKTRMDDRWANFVVVIVLWAVVALVLIGVVSIILICLCRRLCCPSCCKRTSPGAQSSDVPPDEQWDADIVDAVLKRKFESDDNTTSWISANLNYTSIFLIGLATCYNDKDAFIPAVILSKFAIAFAIWSLLCRIIPQLEWRRRISVVDSKLPSEIPKHYSLLYPLLDPNAHVFVIPASIIIFWICALLVLCRRLAWFEATFLGSFIGILGLSLLFGLFCTDACCQNHADVPKKPSDELGKQSHQEMLDVTVDTVAGDSFEDEEEEEEYGSAEEYEEDGEKDEADGN